ncbi:aldehyde dehydrogenase family protein [Lachnospiraceae bacterium 29-84]
MELNYNELNIEKRAFIDGEYVSGIKRETMSRRNSYDGYDLSGITACGHEDVEIAVRAARKSYETGVWKDMPLKKKKEVMLNLADLIEENRKELAMLDTLETCRAFQNYYEDSLPKAIETIRYSAECIDKYYDAAIPPQKGAYATINRIPLGVIAIITPWNDPMVVDAWKYVPALLMGNSVILKPAEQSSLSLIKLADLTLKAGIPKGVFNVLPGYGEIVGKALGMHNDINGIFFTGSSEVGKMIIQYSGMSNMKKVGLECGGKSPFIVSRNCHDLKRAAKILAKNIFYNQGQICSAPSRVIVERVIVEEFVSYLKEECEEYVPGNPFEHRNKVGCIVSKEQYQKVKGYIELAEFEGGVVYQAKNKKEKVEGACCIQPTIITGLSNNARSSQEEIFGPVVSVIEAENLKEAISIGNDSRYGLAGAIFTDDLNEAYYGANHIEAGLVHINSWGEDENNTPFGGIKESGIGKDRSIYAFDEYSQLKTVWMTFQGI